MIRAYPELSLDEKRVETICRLYTEEVWAFVHPTYRPNRPADVRLLDEVDRRFWRDWTPLEFRQRFANVVKTYARSGVHFSWDVDPEYSVMFEEYYTAHGLNDVVDNIISFLPLRDLMARIEKLIREAAYYIWEAEGRPEGRHEEHWQRATAAFFESYS